MTRHVDITRDGAVIEIRLNKPKVNAIDHAMSRELGETFRTLRDDPELRVAILTAAGDRIFSAGWDLKALDSGQAQLDEAAPPALQTVKEVLRAIECRLLEDAFRIMAPGTFRCTGRC